MVNRVPQWRCATLSDLGPIRSGSTPSRTRQRDYYDGGTIPWIKTGDLTNGDILITEERITTRALKESSCVLLEPGAVLIAMYGGFNQIGRTGLTTEQCTLNQAISAISVDESVAIPRFVLAWLNANLFAWKRIAASSRKDPNITRQDIVRFPIQLPTLDEQEAIVEVIEGAGGAVRAADALIEKKVLAKQAIAEELLTGRRRLPEFTDPWAEHHLGDLFDERVETNRTDLKLLSVTGGDGVVDRDSLVKRDTSSEDKSKYLRVCPGDIAYNTMRMWQGVFGLSSLEGIVSPAYTVCIPRTELAVPEFIEQFFKLPHTISLFKRFSQGLVDDTLNLKFHHFSEIKVTLPGAKEQLAIAEVLNTHFQEISLLRSQRDALNEQKKGLMQKLLTGEVRLKEFR